MEEGEAVTKTPFLAIDKKLGQKSSSSSITYVLALSAFAVYCSAFAIGNSIGFSSPTQSGVIHDLGLSSAEYSLFVSISLVGTLLGATWSGKWADLIGRRGAIGFPGLICIMGWLTISFSKDVVWLDVGRFLVGCGGGFSSFGLLLYISEVTPQNVRGAIMSITPVMMSCGKALFFVVGPLVQWRTLAMIGIFPYILQLSVLIFCTESPRWLMKIGRDEDSENALQRLRGTQADISQEIVEIKEFTEYCTRISEDGILSLFQRKYTRCLIIGIGVVAVPQLGGLGGIAFYTNSILQSAGFSSTIGSIAVGIIEILSATLVLGFIDKLGRRPLLLISSAGCCLGCGLIALSFLLQEIKLGETLTPALALAGVLVYFGFFCFGMDGIPWIIVSEIYPVNIKGVGGSIASVISLICGCIVSYTYIFMFEWNSAGIFMIFAAVCGIGVLFIWKMVPETKGLSLEQIQANLISGHSTIAI